MPHALFSAGKTKNADMHMHAHALHSYNVKCQLWHQWQIIFFMLSELTESKTDKRHMKAKTCGRTDSNIRVKLKAWQASEHMYGQTNELINNDKQNWITVSISMFSQIASSFILFVTGNTSLYTRRVSDIGWGEDEATTTTIYTWDCHMLVIKSIWWQPPNDRMSSFLYMFEHVLVFNWRQ